MDRRYLITVFVLACVCSIAGKTKACDQYPIAIIDDCPKYALVNDLVQFDGSNSYDPDGGSITAYDWDFPPEALDVKGDSTAEPNCVFESAGVYVVSLRVKDDEDWWSTWTSCNVFVSSDPCRVYNITQDGWYSHIQLAIDDANEFDELEVQEGTCYESIEFGGKNLTLQSTDPADWDVIQATVIDANGVLDVVTFSSGEDANSVLKGVTITGGGNIGVYCSSSSPIIRNCVIEKNLGEGISCSSSSAVISNNIIRDNASYGGIYLSSAGTTVTIMNNLIYDNTYGVYVVSYTGAVLRNNTVVFNTNTGVHHSATTGQAICFGWASDTHTTLSNEPDDARPFIGPLVVQKRLPFMMDKMEEEGAGFVIFTGDFNEWGPGSYCKYLTTETNLRDGLAAVDYELDPCGVPDPCSPRGIPRHIVMGNHDFKKANVGTYPDPNTPKGAWFKIVKEDPAPSGVFDVIDDGIQRGYYSFSQNGYHFVVLDFNYKANGDDQTDWTTKHYPEHEREWLESDLSTHSSEPTFVFTHCYQHFYPPTDAGNIVFGWSKKIAGQNEDVDPVEDIFAAAGNVKAVFDGHYHPNDYKKRKDIRYYRIAAMQGGGLSTDPNVSRFATIEIDTNGVFTLTGYGSGTDFSDWTETSFSLGEPLIFNCILWGNGDDLVGCSATYSCIEDPNDASGTGNITSNPQFIDPNNDDYHLSVTSPCFNAGDPCRSYDGQVDIDFDPRVMRGRVDMGADEFDRVHNITQNKWYAYIQNAIVDPCTVDGDTVKAYPDPYYENINFKGKAITICSTNPNSSSVVAATIIDAGGVGNTVKFNTSEDSDSVLEGFTVTNGDSYGVYCSNSDPVISKCVIKDNGSHGIYCQSGDPLISECTIEENGSSGIYSYLSADPIIRDNIIRNNSGRGIYVYLSGTPGTASPKIENNKIYDNSGYGIYIYVPSSGSGKAEPTIENNKIYGNSTYGIYGYNLSYTTSRLKTTVKNSWIYENGLYGVRENRGQGEVLNSTIYGHTSKGIYQTSTGSLTVTNCIVWDNNDDLDGCSATYSCIEDSDAEPTNIHMDPNFVDAANDNYHLTAESPCINAADPNYTPDTGETDIDGDVRVLDFHGEESGQARLDMGADEAICRVHNVTKNKWYINISRAITAAGSGDIIEAMDGTYSGFSYNGKAITIRSTDPNDWDVVEQTIISGSFVAFASGEDTDSVLSGFTIKDSATSGGIWCWPGSPTITNCVFTGNNLAIKSDKSGSVASAPLISNCKFYDNTEAIHSTNSSPTIRNSLIYENDYGIRLQGTDDSSVITNCTIVDNTNDGIGNVRGTPDPNISNCILWGNGTQLDSEFDDDITYSCIQDWTGGGEGNIATDPNFVDDTNDIYELTHGSGCIDSANGNVDPPTDMFGQVRIDDPNTPNTGIGDPNYVDMGAYEYNPN